MRNTLRFAFCTFRLGRLRVRNQVSEIRVGDFRFNRTEAAGLLSSGGQPLDDAVVEKFCDRTEGWAAGLVLAGLSLRRSPNPAQFIEGFHGDDQLVVDYLTDEFLAGVNDEHRQRLLESSLLEQFNGALVDAINCYLCVFGQHPLTHSHTHTHTHTHAH